MSYVRKVYEFKNCIEVMDYHTGRHRAPGEKRGKKEKPTPAPMARQNQYEREKKARHKLRANFQEGDYFATFTYARDARPPDMTTAKKHWKDCTDKIREEYRKRGHELKWMRNIEVGTKNAWHIHAVINRIPDTDIILRKAWKFGKVVSQLLHEKGAYEELAAYITKNQDTDPRLKDAKYSTSKNLPVPEPDVKTYLHWRTWDKEKLRVPKGYYVDPNTFFEGKNPVTGRPYRRYTAIKLPNQKEKKSRGKKPADRGKTEKRQSVRKQGKNQGRDAPGGEKCSK